MRSRLGMFAYYQKKGGWGAGPLTLPGGIGYQYTDVDVIKNTLGVSFGPLAPEPSAAYQPLE